MAGNVLPLAIFSFLRPFEKAQFFNRKPVTEMTEAPVNSNSKASVCVVDVNKAALVKLCRPFCVDSN